MAKHPWLILTAILLLVVVVGVPLSIYGYQKLQSSLGAPTGGEVGKVDITTSNFCANNPTIDLHARCRDVNTQTANYRNCTVYLKDTTENSLTTATVDIGGSSNYDTISNALKCGHSYEVYVQTVNTTTDDKDTGSATSAPVKISAQDTQTGFVERTFDVVQLDGIEMRLKDLNDDAYVLNQTSNSDTQAKEWTHIQGGTTTYFYNTTSNNNNVGQSEDVKLQLELKTQSADRQCGLDSNYLCIDSASTGNLTDWNTPSVTMNGAALSPITTFVGQDDKALGDYENCYTIGKITEDVKYIGISLTPQSGIDPDQWPTVKIVCTGIVEDDQNPGVLLIGAGFKTDSSRTEFGLIAANEFKFVYRVY